VTEQNDVIVELCHAYVSAHELVETAGLLKNPSSNLEEGISSKGSVAIGVATYILSASDCSRFGSDGRQRPPWSIGCS
jgi:hypothetical protein